MNQRQWSEVEGAERAALRVLRHNARGPCQGLPRTAGWGYPEPYTRDWLIATFGILATGDAALTATVRTVLETLADNQSPLGHIPSLVHDPEDRGASDTTPLFLVATAAYREAMGEPEFLAGAVDKALCWMKYQSDEDRALIAQLPTSDWRDEQWVLGYGLYVNTLAYTYLRLLGQLEQAAALRRLMTRFTIKQNFQHRHVHEGLAVRRVPYFALWSYKVYSSERFDLLGNSLAILCGVEPRSRGEALIPWVENEVAAMRDAGMLALDVPPNLFPFIQPGDPDWIPRYALHNQPGDYHNGGIWPFVCGFYVAAIVATGKFQLAERKLRELTALVKPARRNDLDFGFNEWLRACDGEPRGQDWQTWSAAMYLYAAHCVRNRRTPFFERARNGDSDGTESDQCNKSTCRKKEKKP